jgi:uncharacterized membrane protein YhaH (DUF805 family)
LSPGTVLPRKDLEVMPMPDRDRSDWMAFVLVVLVFAALLAGLLVIGTDLELPTVGG